MKKYILFFATATVALAGCKKSYLDLNENPNVPSAVSAAALLAAAEVSTARIMVDPSAAYFNVWMDQWAFSPNYAVNQDLRDYRFTNTFQQGLFTDFYSNGFDYQKMIDFAIAQNNPALEGIGRTMKSMLMQYAVDVYNNVPYSEAFKGANNQTPVYDDAKTVYEAIYTDLNLAITKFKAPTAVFPSATQDIMFGGDKDLWIKLANTIKLRILLRQSGRADRASYISTHIAADFPDKLNSFLQAGESAIVNPGFSNADTKQTPYWGSFGYSASGSKTGNNDYFKSADYAVKFYTSQQDDRGFFVEKPIGVGVAGAPGMFGISFRGNEMGSQGTSTLTYSDNMNNFTGLQYRFPSEPQAVLTDYESLFLQAEAVQRGWFPGDAQTIFENAMRQSYHFMFDATDGAAYADDYYDLDRIPDARNEWTLAANKIQLIITQKWASLNTVNFFESWADYRRTGFPNVPLSSSLSRGPNIPVRLKYPQFEYDLNGENVAAQGNVDQFTSKIWWMP